MPPMDCLTIGQTKPSSALDAPATVVKNTAKTEKMGDGKIFVLDVQQAVRVRTGETNDDAL